MKDEPDKAEPEKTSRVPVVRRSTVPTNLKYREYRKYLRKDFLYSCAYCTMTESEARGKRMTIDHYKPQESFPDLVNDYLNLIYACDECNTNKNRRWPTDGEQASGMVFFRPDEHFREDHFAPNGVRIDGLTPGGQYTIDALSLNRLSLRKLREIRKRIHDSADHIFRGLQAFESYAIDDLPEEVRTKVLGLFDEAGQRANELVDDLNRHLIEAGRSELLDDDRTDEEVKSDEAEDKERLRRLRGTGGLHAGGWGGRKSGRAKRS